MTSPRMKAQVFGLIGYGELGQLVQRWLLESLPESATFTCFDDVASQAARPSAEPFSSYASEEYDHLHFLVCLGYRQPSAKQAVLSALKQSQRHIATLIHRHSIVSPSAQIGEGVITGPGVVLDSGVSLAEGSLIHCNATVAHDARIGTCAYVSPGAVICGRASVGERTFIGAGAIIRDAVTLGHDCRIGMGAVVDRDIPDGVSAVGSPLRILNRQIEL
jgi:sugar O-acyltransferase (sialic acid O-acetyltransferase NeuD family)